MILMQQIFIFIVNEKARYKHNEITFDIATQNVGII